MRAFTLDSFETPPGLRDDVPAPTAGANEVLVRVHASSVNPADAAIAAGMLKGMAEYEFPVTLGRDFAGVVEGTGQGVHSYEAGDEVYGFVLHASPTARDGSWADYAVVPDTGVARKPARVDFATAGAVPLAALTALAALDASSSPRTRQSSSWVPPVVSGASSSSLLRQRARASSPLGSRRIGSTCRGWAPARSSTATPM